MSLSTPWKCNTESLVYYFDFSHYLVDILKQDVLGFSNVMRPFKLQINTFQNEQQIVSEITIKVKNIILLVLIISFSTLFDLSATSLFLSVFLMAPLSFQMETLFDILKKTQ